MKLILFLLILCTGLLAQTTTNARSFGCKGDGTTDDTMCAQNAINAVQSTGGTLSFPVSSGAYMLGALSITKGNMSIRCDKGVVLRVNNGTNADFITIGGSAAVSNVTIEGCELDGNAAAQTSSFPIGRGIFGNGSLSYPVSNVTVKDCNIHDFRWHGIYSNLGNSWLVHDNTFSNNGDSAIELSWGSQLIVTGNVDNGSKYGLTINGSDGDNFLASFNVVANNSFINSGLHSYEGDCIHFYGYVSDSIISNNVVRGCLNSGIALMSGPMRNLIIGNRIERPAQGGTGQFAAIYLRGSLGPGTNNNTVVDNFIRGDRVNYGVQSDGLNVGNVFRFNQIQDAPVNYSLTQSDQLTDQAAVPTSASSACSVGQVAYDSTHIYRCVAPNTWLRVTLAAW